MGLKNIALTALFTVAVLGGGAEFLHHTDNKAALQAQVMQSEPGSLQQGSLIAARETEHGKGALGLLAVMGALVVTTGGLSLRKSGGPS